MKAEDARHTTATPYEGTNEVINRLMGDSKVWIVQGVIGRLVIIADSAGEAEANYNARENKWRKDDT